VPPSKKEKRKDREFSHKRQHGKDLESPHRDPSNILLLENPPAEQRREASTGIDELRNKGA